MIRIAFVIDSIVTPGAGTERQLLMLLEKLDRREFDPTLVCLRSSDWLSGRTLPCDLHVLDVGSLKSLTTAGALARFAALHRLKRFDIAQTFFIDANIFGTMAARFAGVRRVVSSRRDIGYWHTRAQVVILRLLRHATDHYLANSRAAADLAARVEGIPTSKLTVIPNGLDLAAFDRLDESTRSASRTSWGIAPDETVVGTVANLRPVKNLGSLVAAAARLAPEFPRLRFVVVGEGPDREVLDRQIAAAGLQDRFLLPGAATDVIPCLAAFDIAVQCSHSESLSGALLEAMAAGLPVAAARVGGNPEAVTHGRTGLLYDPATDGGLADTLRLMLSDPGRAAEMGHLARDEARSRFGLGSCIRQHEDFYRRITSPDFQFTDGNGGNRIPGNLKSG